ncbi:DHA2 family efflux MFS transporter permease subunit [Candidatus Laterigemmans baculatus]|uniref:DHA2 family efflux MFS transporter permease subunit n=1 Tax=Candidatus Laterigemmans baculatus TaxID=2770505 RepID=UPI0013DD67AC|nr:DHA2 family efflux MFS transporter permease subunit [Candidatus Laterigemmans baculatus]
MTNTEDDRQATPPGIPVRTWKIAAVTGTGAFLAMLDSTLANLALESIRDSLSSTLPVVQWVATGYLLALAVSLPATGWLGNRFGYGRLWAISLFAFIAASALCGLAPGPLALIGGRVLQGLAAGIMVPAGQAVIGSVAGPTQLGRLFGLLGLVISLGPAVGPAVGGLLLEVVSWRWLFWINVPIGLAALAVARGLVPGGSSDSSRPLDRCGLVLLGIGLPLLLFGAAEVGSAGATLLPATAALVGAAMIFVFALTRVRVAAPLINLGLLRRPTFAAATVTTGFTGANMYGGLLLLPLYLQLARGRGTTETGLMLLVMGLGSAVALPVGGIWTDRSGAGLVTITGAGLLVATTVPFLFNATPSLMVLSLLLGVRGVGIALAQMPAMTAAYGAVSSEQMGDAATLVNLVQRIGGAIGTIGLVIVLARAGGESGAYWWAFAMLLIISSLTMVSAAMLKRSTRPSTSSKI